MDGGIKYCYLIMAILEVYVTSDVVAQRIEFLEAINLGKGERGQNGNYFFSLNRYLFLARKFKLYRH
ncbi:unnamed protein product [marine sediment metagenome]|uniref:Uncharacterized protein n=1 Tax=marine sediment metagenome TaxID=412755 RepID=X1BVI0_9ZZZZ